MSGGVRVGRPLLLVALGLSALVPFALLATLSVGARWLYPAVLPPEVTLDGWARLLEDGSRLRRATASSLALACGTGVLATIVGFVAGRAIARLRGWRRYAGAGAAFLPVAAPPVALAVGLQVSLLSVGLGGEFAGVLLAHAVPAAGYVSLFCLGIFSVFDARVEEQARSLGATPVQVLGRVTLPLLRVPLAEGFVLGFLVSWAQVPLTLVVGQGLVPALPVEVLSYVQAGQDTLGAAGALLLTLPPLVTMGVLGLVVRRTQVVTP